MKPLPSEQAAATLVIRLGAMGDILHALPAVASLKLSFPHGRLIWLVSRKWMPLLAGNPYIDQIVSYERPGVFSLFELRRSLRQLKADLAIDFQGLLQSAIIGRSAGPRKFFGFDRQVAREPLASFLYTDRVSVTGPHRIERNLQLVQALGAHHCTQESWIPDGVEDCPLPAGPYVLASPFAGWAGKEWPLERYDRLGALLAKQGIPLLLNVAARQSAEIASLKHVTAHISSLDGLIHATRLATAVVGVDSGPLHLAAALKKAGVALYGPTDPAQTGPFRAPITVLRQQSARTTYKRHREPDQSMHAISVEQVAEALACSLHIPTEGPVNAARVP